MKLLRKLSKNAFFMLHRTELGSRASILSYHNIGDDSAFFTVGTNALDEQLRYIKKHYTCTMFLSELAQRLGDGKNISGCVVLTFNDGYKSLYVELFPLLKEYKLPATVFLSVELLDTTVQTSDGHTFTTLNPTEIKEMQESGLVEFMPQAQHRVALETMPFDVALERIETARRNVESIMGKDAAVFSYSKSKPTERFAEHLRSRQWLGAVYSREGLVHPHTDPFFLPRNAINSETTFTQFKGKLGGAIEEYVEMRKGR